MDLNEALRTTGATREFHPEPVSDETLHRLLDTARFAPSGGNRQAWRVVVVRDAEKKRKLRDLYLDGWYEYVAIRQAGLTPWAPLTDRDAEQAAASRSPEVSKFAAAHPGFAERLDQAPVLLVLLADLRALAAVDRDLDRYSMVGGASIYPFAWNLLLAARAEGLGGVLTTVAVRREDELRALLEVPGQFAVAGVIVLGRPLRRRTRLTRLPVESFTTVDSFKGRPFS